VTLEVAATGMPTCCFACPVLMVRHVDLWPRVSAVDWQG